ncbi:response regulator [Alsobacter soli]|uniref:Response regulator n=1 Tax=Alsobacter soli TaxID=2109933 RepID=A0A2T1HUD5_9HYPH|nr:response regulator [Alsobacter soli]
MRTVLVVDDEWAIAEVLEDILSDEGFRVVVANNGRQGLERALAEKPDLILLDFMMPVLDGPGMLAALAEDERVSGTRVILMSSLPEATVRERCSGYAAFLRKPFLIDDVLATIQNIVTS